MPSAPQSLERLRVGLTSVLDHLLGHDSVEELDRLLGVVDQVEEELLVEHGLLEVLEGLLGLAEVDSVLVPLAERAVDEANEELVRGDAVDDPQVLRRGLAREKAAGEDAVLLRLLDEEVDDLLAGEVEPAGLGDGLAVEVLSENGVLDHGIPFS